LGIINQLLDVFEQAIFELGIHKPTLKYIRLGYL